MKKASDDQELVRTLKALGHPGRLQLLRLLASPDRFPSNLVDPCSVGVCVNDLARAAELPQSTASHHLKLLEEAGLVVTTVHGSWHYVRIRTEAFERLGASIAALPA